MTNYKSTKDTRDMQMKVLWTEDELEAIRVNARLAGIAPSAYVRLLALHALRQIHTPKPELLPQSR